MSDLSKEYIDRLKENYSLVKSGKITPEEWEAAVDKLSSRTKDLSSSSKESIYNDLYDAGVKVCGEHPGVRQSSDGVYDWEQCMVSNTICGEGRTKGFCGPTSKWKEKQNKKVKGQKARFEKHEKRKETLDEKKEQLAKRKTPSEKWKEKHHEKRLDQAARLGCSEDLCKLWFPEDAVFHLAVPFKSKGYVGPSGTITDTGGFRVWCGPGNLEEGCHLPPEWELLEHPLLSWYFTDERGESNEVTVNDGYPAPRESHGKEVIVGKKKMINDTWLYQLPFFEIKEEPATDCCVPVFWNKEKDFKATCENFIGFRCDGLIKPDGLTTITKSLERVKSRNINADFWGAWYTATENEDGTIQEPRLAEGDLVDNQGLIEAPCACDCYEEQYQKIGFWEWEKEDE